MRDTVQFYERTDRSLIESQRRMTFYEVCLTSCEEGIAGGAHLTELADLSEALESIYARRAVAQGIPQLPAGFGLALDASPGRGQMV